MLQGGDEEAIQSGQPRVTGSDRRAGQEGREKLQHGGQVPERQVSRRTKTLPNKSCHLPQGSPPTNLAMSIREVPQQTLPYPSGTQHGHTLYSHLSHSAATFIYSGTELSFQFFSQI